MIALTRTIPLLNKSTKYPGIRILLLESYLAKELLKRTYELSVHQLGAMSTIIMTKKILQSGKPEFIADQMIVREAGGTRSGNTMQLARSSLTLSREGFLYRGSKLFNLLPENLRNENKISKFKREAKAWVKLNIAVKP